MATTDPVAVLRAALARMTGGRWTAECIGGCDDEPDTAVYQVPQALVVATSDGDYLNGHNAIGIALLRNVAPALLDVVEAARVLRDSIQWHERPGRTGWGVGALSLEVYDTAIDTLRAAVARETEADHE